MRPKRNFISESSLVLMGVPKRFCKNTLDDFEATSPALKKVKDFVRDYLDDLEDHAELGEGICFMGANGVGKSMLSCIILKEFYRNRFSCQRVTFSNYINSYTEDWGSKDSADRFSYEKYKSAEFLILEEIGKEVSTKVAKPILEDLLRYREEKGLVTVICTNLTPENLREMYGPSVCSLINGNMQIVMISSEDRRVRR